MNKPLLCAAIGVVTICMGCRASSPGGTETKLMNEIKQKVTIGGKDDKNPIAYSQAAVDTGKGHFMHHCQICHGYDGQNTGVPFAEKMSPPVANLADKDVQDYTDGQLHWIIKNGIRPSGMPGWDGVLEEDEMWNIVHYMRHLPPKGSLGAPEIYKEEEEQHEQMEHGGAAQPHAGHDQHAEHKEAAPAKH